MTKAEQRCLALGAARVQLRRMGVNLDSFVPFKCVLEVLDDLHRAEPEVIASQWYAQANDHQIQLLRREWKQTVKPVYERTLWRSIPGKTSFERVKEWRIREKRGKQQMHRTYVSCLSL